METLLLSREEAGRQAEALYLGRIRREVETPDNIGKMVVIDVATGGYSVDTLGFDAALRLRKINPSARLVALRIGYDVAAALGGILNRVS